MSQVSNRHSVLPFVAGESKPLNNQRLAKIGYKGRGDKEAKFKSVCVSVPHIAEPLSEEQINQLMPHIRGIMENAQDGIIRSLYENSKGNLSSVSDDEISFEAIIGYLDAESTGGRLTKEYLNAWFDAQIKDNLSVVIAEKLGTEDIDSPAVMNALKVYKELISSLSGGATILQKKQIEGVRKAMEIGCVDDDTSKKLSARLDKMEKPTNISEMLEL
jgi:hypothetical protein